MLVRGAKLAAGDAHEPRMWDIDLVLGYPLGRNKSHFGKSSQIGARSPAISDTSQSDRFAAAVRGPLNAMFPPLTAPAKHETPSRRANARTLRGK